MLYPEKTHSNVFQAFLVFFVLLSQAVHAREFYDGKTIKVVVGYAPGGGYDFYARMLARYMGKYIPGNPAFIVENMPGAGSLASANYMYKLAKPDGLTLGHFSGSLFPLQAMGQNEIAFDGAKFEHVGGVAKVEVACGFAKSSGIDNVEKWLAQKTAPRMPATAPGTGGHDTSRLLHATLGVPMQLVLGYKSTGEMRLAMERGEVHGICNGWETFRSLWKKSIETGDMIMVLQALPQRSITATQQIPGRSGMQFQAEVKAVGQPDQCGAVERICGYLGTASAEQ